MECFECMKNGFEFWSNGEMIFDNVVIGTNDIPQTKISVSPNPATQSFKIEGDYTSIPEVVLYNMVGEVILRKTNVFNEREIYFPPNTPKGIYFLKVVLDENRIISKKLVVH